MPDSSNHSLYLMKLFVFSCPEGNKLLDCSIRFRSSSLSSTNMCMRMCMCAYVYVYESVRVCARVHVYDLPQWFHVFCYILHMYICYHESSRKPQHSKWNSLGPKHAHSTGTCTATWCNDDEISNSNLLINSQNHRNRSDWFSTEWYSYPEISTVIRRHCTR